MSIKIDFALVNNKLIGMRMISITTHIIEHINKIIAESTMRTSSTTTCRCPVKIQRNNVDSDNNGFYENDFNIFTHCDLIIR